MRQILVFLLVALILCWVIFAPVYKHVLIMREAALQNETDMLLEIGAGGMHGYIDAAMIAASKARLADKGFDAAQLRYKVETTSGVSGTNPSAPVPRGAGIELSISYPYGQLFAIDRLIGITAPSNNARMKTSGIEMSEYVP